MEVTMEGPAESGNDNRDQNLICPPVSSTDSNGNNDNLEDNDNINEAGSEDSGMSSVDNHNLPGRHPVIHISRTNQYRTQHTAFRKQQILLMLKLFKTYSTDVR